MCVSRGLKFDGIRSPLEGLWFNFSGAIAEARWIDFKKPSLDAARTWTTTNGSVDPFANLPSSLQVGRSNSHLNAAPVYSFNVGANDEKKLDRLFEGRAWWDQPVTGFAYVNVAWRNKTLATNPDAVFHYWQPAYTITNLGFGVKTDDERYSLALCVKNLTNQLPILNTGQTAIDPGTATAPATVNFYRFPRTIGGTLRVSPC